MQICAQLWSRWSGRPQALRRLCAGLVLALFTVSIAAAQQVETASADAATASPAFERAKQVQLLTIGELPPSVDASSLFAADLKQADGRSLGLLLRLLEDPDLLATAEASGAVSGEPADVVALAVAQANFLSLPAEERTALLEAHAQRVANAAQEETSTREKERRLEELDRQAAALEAFLDGRPADTALLSVDLLNPAEIALDVERRSAMQADVSPTDPDASGAGTEPVEPASADDANTETTLDDAAPAPEDLDARLAAAEARLDQARERLLRLSQDEINQLLAAQERPATDLATVSDAQAQADEAARLAAEAAAEAERAATETLRLIAQERSRMLAVRQAQAAFEADLAGRGDPQSESEEQALRFRREVRELQATSRLSESRAVRADQLYAETVEALKRTRQELSTALQPQQTSIESDLTPPELDSGLPAEGDDANEVRGIRAELIANAQRLAALERDYRSKKRAALYGAMVALNDVRLSLISDLSAARRSDIVGYGDEGIAQVGRELNQIGLIARYNLANGPALLEQSLRPFLSPTPQLIFTVIQIVIIAFVFRFWRRTGDSMLAGMRFRYLARRPATVWSSLTASTLGYVRDVRRPLEWLLLALGLRWLIADQISFVGDNVVWTIIIGALAAATLVQMANRLAASSRANDPRRTIRENSLRLIAIVTVCVVLTLAITAELVGKGAIYNWVLSACWLLAPLVAVILSYWWRDRIVTLAEASGKSNFLLRWAVRHREGVLGHISRVLAGGVLVIQGVSAIIRNRLNDIALIRELTDQSSRKAAAAQAAADEASGLYQPLSVEQLELLAPHRLPETPDPEPRTPSGFDLPELSEGQTIAVVGERGLGKSTALNDLVRNAPAEAVLRLQVVDGGVEDLFSSLAEALGVENEEDAIIRGLRERDIAAVLIDDFQRMFVPAIGGLYELDRFVTFARNAQCKAAWLFAIGGPAMTYIGRARSDHSMFDEVLYLPRWTAEDLRALLERRTDRAGVSPVFDLKSEAALSMFDSELSPDERVKRSYYDRLEDLSGGNPAIALDIWRQSLMTNKATGKVEVRSYSGPATDEVVEMPESTLFVLRAMMQMEVATPEKIRRSTDLDGGLVAEAVRRLERLGVIHGLAGGYRIRLNWYRSVGLLLERRNLIVRDFA